MYVRGKEERARKCLAALEKSDKNLLGNAFDTGEATAEQAGNDFPLLPPLDSSAQAEESDCQDGKISPLLKLRKRQEARGFPDGHTVKKEKKRRRPNAFFVRSRSSRKARRFRTRALRWWSHFFPPFSTTVPPPPLPKKKKKLFLSNPFLVHDRHRGGAAATRGGGEIGNGNKERMQSRRFSLLQRRPCRMPGGPSLLIFLQNFPTSVADICSTTPDLLAISPTVFPLTLLQRHLHLQQQLLLFLPQTRNRFSYVLNFDWEPKTKHNYSVIFSQYLSGPYFFPCCVSNQDTNTHTRA